ncbi:MAG: hypothetical protein LBU04_00115 [Christensenellaceae bacterium]|nr:hypothetical protein [Christensenellaceae bacterium]
MKSNSSHIERSKFFLIGNPLGHSFSPMIHNAFGYDYETLELTKDEIVSFIASNKYDGFNVTIPYKIEIIKYLDSLDQSAIDAGSVNTVVRRKNSLIGYNTDVKGMRYMLNQASISLFGEKVLILGSGGTAKTAISLASNMGAREIVIVGRNSENNYSNLNLNYDADIIINATPVGMFPKNDERLIDITPFSKLNGVVEVIYNPRITDLLFQAKELKIKHTHGLRMLVAQAKYARDIFLDITDCDSVIEKVYSSILSKTLNIVLIGMPSSGKTYVGEHLAKVLNRPFYDSDALSVDKMGVSIPYAFETFGESYFRQVEHEVCCGLGKKQGNVISVGGGAVFNGNCYHSLKQNGIIVHLVRDLNLTDFSGRPLLTDIDALGKLFLKRFPLYNSMSDFSVSNNGLLIDTTSEIINKFNNLTK